MSETASPPERDVEVSVIVATAGRPDSLRTCLASILANHHPSFEVVVVEQSAEAAELPDDPRLRRIRSATTGKSAALNVGLAAARADVLAFTDDDCTVPRNWLASGTAVLAAHPEIALVFGELIAPEHDPSAVFIPCAAFPRFRVVEGERSAFVRGGAGANMFARRSLYTTIGPYDEQIGPGSRFHACEEYDIYCRTLHAGHRVAFSPTVSVVHHGARSYSDGSGQMLKRWYAFGEGAVIAKHLRLGEREMIRPAVVILGEDLREVLRSLRHRRLAGIGVLAYKLRGLLTGLTTGVDRANHVYRT